MVNLILGISITLNIILFLAIFIYLKIRFIGKKQMEKEFKKMFYSDEELDNNDFISSEFDILNKIG